MKPSDTQGVRFRWWWAVLAFVWSPWIVATLPLWVFVLAPWRFGGFPVGVGWIGGAPRTAVGRWYGASAVLRVSVWVVVSVAWVMAAEVWVPADVSNEAHVAVFGLVFGFGWWWHLERTLGRRRLLHWLGAATTDDDLLGPDPTWGGYVGKVAATEIETTHLPKSETAKLWRPRASEPRLWDGDLRLRAAGVSARMKAAQEMAGGKTRAQVNSWLVGADGEELVAEQLGRLPAGWTVLHDVPVGIHGANIDHVVIGPGGVFTLNTKHHRNKDVVVGGGPLVSIGGWVSNYTHKSTQEAQRASTLLSLALGNKVTVTPMLVFVGAKSIELQGECPVLIATDENVEHLPSQFPSVLTEREVEAIVHAAARPTTWTRTLPTCTTRTATRRRT